VTLPSAKCTGTECIEVPSEVPKLSAAIVENKSSSQTSSSGTSTLLQIVETAETVCKVPEVLDETRALIFGKPVTVDTVPEAVASACTVCAV